MAGRVRKSVPLSEDDLAGLASLRRDLAWREAAMELEGVELSANPSEAEALQTLVEVGRRTIERRAGEKELEAGYAALAASMSDEDRELGRALSRRTSARSSGE